MSLGWIGGGGGGGVAEPPARLMSRAHAVFRDVEAEWTVRRVDGVDELWVMEHHPPYQVAGRTAVALDPAAYKFIGPGARERALLMRRDKCLREVVKMVLRDESDATRDGEV